MGSRINPVDESKKPEELLKSVRQLLGQVDFYLDNIVDGLEKKRVKYHNALKELSELSQFSQFDKEKFDDFLKEPYAVIPTSKRDEWYVAVPKFIRMNLGWLDYTTNSFNIFRINKFMNWLGDIPNNIRNKFKFEKKLPLTVFDGVMLTGKEHQDDAWGRYSKFLTKREGKDRIKIKKGYEFHLIAKLIDDGILPFIPKPIEKSDMRDPQVSFELRDYQKDAWQRFKETGAVGIYWPFSAGKTFFGMYALASVKGPKLIVVPTLTLVEQWSNRIRDYTNIASEVKIVTYHSFHKIKEDTYSLAIYDECHHLPSNMFSKFATIRTKYRIGLSGSPVREDGRTNYIFSLTGFPIGLSWDNLIELGIIEEPDIRLYILPSWREKEKKLKELLGIQKKTIVFCDSIPLGKRLSKEFEIPFVYGASKDRLGILEQSDTTIVSRVGDEGLSIGDIERVIELDFLFGSRRQEGQRMGRLFHGEEKGEHIILMSEAEFDKYEKRLYAIYQKGFKIELIR